MADGKRSRAERSNGVAILASFLVIAVGLAGAVVVCTISAPDPRYAIPAAIGLFLLIAALPFNAMRERSRDSTRVYVKGPGIFRRLKDWAFSPRDEEKPEPRTWKRRKVRTTQAANSVFVPEGQEAHKAPFMG
jgi:hypothetical protein